MARAVQKFVVVAATAMLCLGGVLIAGGIAEGAPVHAHPGAAAAKTARPHRARANVRPLLRFDMTDLQAVMYLPVPLCPATQPNCQWMLYMNEPDNPSAPGMQVIGTTGPLVLPLPAFCGPVQIDALIGPGTWVRRGGFVREIDNCNPPPSTTTTTSTSTTTTTTSTTTTTRPSTSTTSTVPPSVAGSQTGTPNGTSNDGSTTALPFTDTTTGTSPTVAATSSSASLPFTGALIRPMIALGILLVAIGGLLLMSEESRRRTGRKLADWFW